MQVLGWKPSLFSSVFAVVLVVSVVSLLGCGSSNKQPNQPGVSNGGTSGGGSGGGSGSGGTSGGSGGSGGTGGSGSTASVPTEIVASGLTIPWSLQFAPDGRLFFTEQPGRLRVIANGQLQTAPVFDVSADTAGGEAGLTGMALDSNFGSNHYIYIFWCHKGDPAECDVQRLIESNGTATYDQTLLSFQEAAHDHTGGRLKVGPDNMLYLSVGDWDNPPLAQDTTSYAGKILRFALDGSPAPGNPISSAPYIYALGFRDPQGLAWDSSGQLYGTDNGATANDEVDIINAGGNYGWPDCTGTCGLSQYVDPIKLFTGQSVPPSGATFYSGTAIPQWTGSLFFATMGLASNTAAHHLHRIQLDKPGGTTIVQEEELFKDEFGRLRDVTEGPDGFLYFSTSNGNGTDKIIRVRPN
ncbi:MAG TPA: PQQ-dependent sugar dehydrogenase [Terriglobales bacterium]